MWENAGEDLREFMNDRYPKKGLREKRLLWKSYVLQEAEAVGRDAKIAWAVDHGIPVHSLQHDCVFLGKLPGQLIGRDDQKLADALSKAVALKGRVSTFPAPCLRAFRDKIPQTTL